MDFDPGCVATAEGQAGGPEADFHRVAERGKPDDLDFFALQHAQIEESLDERGIALKR